MADGLNNILSYAGLMAKKSLSFKYPVINSFIPNPNEMDFKTGYIERYFLQKVNDINAPIVEVNETNFNSMKNSGYYNGVSIKWKIKGTDEEIKMANKKSINTVISEMPRLAVYLPNLLQFSKNNLGI
jgi:hypothetical protein